MTDNWNPPDDWHKNSGIDWGKGASYTPPPHIVRLPRYYLWSPENFRHVLLRPVWVRPTWPGFWEEKAGLKDATRHLLRWETELAHWSERGLLDVPKVNTLAIKPNRN